MSKPVYNGTCPHVCIGNRWIPADRVKILKAEEDYAGYHFIVTFKYRNKTHKSLLLNKPR